MVAHLTQGKAKSPEAEAALAQAAEKAQRLKDALVLAVDEDASAFTAYMEARRLPAGTPEEKAARDTAMQDGLKIAIDVPWSTAKACFEAMEVSEITMHHGNPAALSDSMVGLHHRVCRRPRRTLECPHQSQGHFRPRLCRTDEGPMHRAARQGAGAACPRHGSWRRPNGGDAEAQVSSARPRAIKNWIPAGAGMSGKTVR